MKRSRFTILGATIITAEVLAATAACLAAITGVVFVAHCCLPVDLHDVF